MTGWAELKDAFWAAVEREPTERARHVAALAATDPELARRLEVLLAADARGESLRQIFEPEAVAAQQPTRIGVYDIVGAVGVGGMGEVYRAHDSRLHRDVAIKVLPAALTDDPERLARFEHEAQVLASLNHPHIARVYGLEDSGSVPALVMELVEGPTLGQVIADFPNNPITLRRSLTIARQIADGLDAAHEKGIVHRDLKPGNVALTPEGDVKILDFGVAKSLDTGTPAAARTPAATEAGVVIGTPAYMSPEQARGLTVDKRTDIWAFGCLLYELLTGRQPFAGDTPSDSLAAVLAREPDMTLVPATTPDAIRSLLRHCLEKEPRRRLRDIADARLTIDDVLKQGADTPARFSEPVGGWPRGRIAVGGVAVLALVGFAAAMAGRAMRVPEAAPPATGTERVMTSIVLPRGMYLSGADLEARAAESRLAVSPDGRRLALIAADESGHTQLWLRDLASSVFRPLPETDEASFPFWSPDSASIGFVARGKLKAIAVSGGTPRTVSESAFRTGAWSRGNRILFSPGPSSPLHVVPATGGPSAAATRLDTATGETQHAYPVFLPDGRHFLYFSMGSVSGGALDPRGVYLGSLDGGGMPRLLLATATQARYANGHLLFVHDGTLTAHPFDTERMELHGAPFPLVEDVKLFTAGATGATSAFSVSDNGVLVYQAALRTESRLVVFDRTGTELGTLTAPADYADVALSADGARVAVSMRDSAASTRDLWMYDVAGGRGQRLTFSPNDEFAPVWAPDGARLLFSSMTRSGVDLHVKDFTSAGDPVRLDVDALGLGRFAADWSRDGSHILYIGGGRAIARSDLWVAPVRSASSARALLESPFVETHGRFAPGGRWFVYTSNETGTLEVYADRFPERGAKRLISTGGGGWPRWTGTGSEILYLSPDNRLMSAAVRATADRLHVATPRPLFSLRPRPPARLDAYCYDVFPDGRRFVVNTLTEDTTPTAITLVLNWTVALTER